ncbi:MAG: hypothetical protein JW874_05495 [Spirochaetales bacterium]|nr:hypothetical protein [Spirochaetales bacterium]
MKYLVLIMCLCIQVAVYSVDLDSGDMELEIEFLIIPEFTIGLPSMNKLFLLDAASVSTEGEYRKKLLFSLETDLAGLLDNEDPSLSEVLESCYFQYKFMKELKLRLGLFTVPVSEELFLGLNERPSIDHSSAIKNLAPGSNIGIMVHGKDIINLFGYDLGLFNSLPPDQIMDAQSDLALAGKAYIKAEPFSRLSVKAGYSAYYSFSEIFAHSVFADLYFTVNEHNSIHLFSEYLEQRYYNYYWNNAFTAFIAWRCRFFEAYFRSELFDRNTAEAHSDDRILLSPGLNFYTCDDHMRFGIQYTAERKNEQSFTHLVSVYSVLKI